jgi:hypothetical protein
MKRLLAYLLSSVLWFNGIAISTVYASERTGSGTTSTTLQQQAEAQQSSEAGAQNLKTFTPSGAKGLEVAGDYISILVLIAVGMVVKSMMLACVPKTMDMWIATAGAVIYIAGELMTLLTFKSESNSKVDYVENQLTEAQVQTLEEQKGNYEKAKKAADNKAMLQMAAAAAFLAALATAGILGAKYKATELAWMTNLKASAAKVEVVAAAEAKTQATLNPAASAAALAAAKEVVATNAISIAAIVKQSATNEIPAASIAQEAADLATMTSLAAALNAELAAGTAAGSAGAVATSGSIAAVVSKDNVMMATVKALKLQSFSVCNPAVLAAPIASNGSKSLHPLLDSFLPLVLNSAYASGNPLKQWGLPIAVVAVLLLSKTKLALMVDNWLYSPFKRMALWGVFAGMMGAGVMMSKAASGRIQKNIDEIDKILAQHRARLGQDGLADLSNGTGTGNQQLINNRHTNGPRINIDDPALTFDGSALQCQVGVAKNGRCVSAREGITNAISTANIPLGATVGGAAQLAGQVVDSLQGQSVLNREALAAINDLGGRGAALNKIRKKVEDKINDDLKKAGQKPLDNDKFAKDFMANATGLVKKAMNEKGMSSAGLLAAFGPLPVMPATEKASDAELEEAIAAVAVPGAPGTAVVSPGVGSGNLDLGLDDEVLGEELTTAAVALPEEEVIYDADEELVQINQRKEESIFNIISVRYLKTALPRFSRKAEN